MACAVPAGARRIIQHEQAQEEALMDAKAKGVVTDSLRQAKEQLETLKASEEKSRQDALNQKAHKVRVKWYRERQYENDCTWKCSGWACLGKPFKLLRNWMGHCQNLKRQMHYLNHEINYLHAKSVHAQREIDRLTGLITSKHTAAETAEDLEQSISAKKAEIVLEHKLMKDEEQLNDLEGEDKRSTHEAQLANLDDQIAAIDKNITALQDVYDRLTEEHTVESCEEKEAKKERICLKCAPPQKPCGDHCVGADDRCHKLLGCACQAGGLSFVELSGAKEDSTSHPLRQAIQDTRQRIGEAIHVHNKTIYSHIADLDLNALSMKEAEREKERVMAEFDDTLQKLQDSKADLETRKAEAEEKMQAAKGELANAIQDSEVAIGSLKEALLAEIKRLTEEKLSLKTAKDNLEQTYLQEEKAMLDAHTAEKNGLSARINGFEAELRELRKMLEKLKSDHNV